jgi:hypothetical protein
MKHTTHARRYGRTYLTSLVAGFGLTLTMLPGAARAQFTCAGDCQGTGMPAVNDVIILVNIVLGNAQASACPDGIPPGDTPSVTLIIQTVNNILNGTCVAPPTPTPTPGMAACGDGVIEAPETCDNGGTCIGGDNAGAHCTAESDCMGQGVCIGGSKNEWACDSNSDCDSNVCRKCVVQGGTGCAANCTMETDVPFNLVPGVVSNGTIQANTSGAVVHGDSLTIPLPLTGGQTFTIGHEGADGTIPIVVKASSVHFPAINVGGIACACVRGEAAQTCGGTLFNKDGSTTTDCTAGFVQGSCSTTATTSCYVDSDCPSGETCKVTACNGTKPCTYVHGSGNSATGIVACGAGLTGIDLSFTQDNINGTPSPAQIMLSGTGPAGSGILLNSTAIGQALGACTGTDTTVYGADGMFCTDDDPFGTNDQGAPNRGTVATLPLTTGTATAEFTNANGTADDTICVCGGPSAGSPSCPASDCTSPWTVMGAPIDCTKLEAGNVSGFSTAGAFTSPGQNVIGDAVVTDVFFAQ